MKNLLKTPSLVLTGLLTLLLCSCGTLQMTPEQLGMSDADYQTAMVVYERLGNDPVTGKYQFQVVADGGVITLSGWVNDAQVRSRALSIAQGAQRVQAVVDRMSY